MKKYIIISILMIALGLSVNAQGKRGIFGAASDTINANDTVYSGVIHLKSDVVTVGAIQFESDSLSGTPAYTVAVQKSIDGVNWVVESDYTAVTTTTGVDTSFIMENSSAQYFEFMRLRVIAGAGAQTARIKATAMWRELN